MLVIKYEILMVVEVEIVNVRHRAKFRDAASFRFS